jgi:hypothetical protein
MFKKKKKKTYPLFLVDTIRMDYFLIRKNEIILILILNSDYSCSDGDEKEEKIQYIGVLTKRRKLSLISSNALQKHNFK